MLILYPHRPVPMWVLTLNVIGFGPFNNASKALFRQESHILKSGGKKKKKRKAVLLSEFLG